MSFPRNAWYAAGWGSEVETGLVHRQVADDHLVLFRQDGIVGALSDTCPHRFAPLHRGMLLEDGIQCPYHGLKFGFDGRCFHNPQGSGLIPPRMRLRTYLCVERHRLIWVWLGEAGEADVDMIPEIPFLDDPFFVTECGTIIGSGHYELYSDNILDLGHANYLHEGLAADAFVKGRQVVREENRSLLVSIDHENEMPSPVVQLVLQRFNERVTYHGETRWHAPATLTFHSWYTPLDSTAGTRPDVPTLHIFTPEGKDRVRYLWAFGRAREGATPALMAGIREGVVRAFDCEDKPMIAAQAERMAGRDFSDMKPQLLPTDEASVRARRLLRSLIESEDAGEPARSAERRSAA